MKGGRQRKNNHSLSVVIRKAQSEFARVRGTLISSGKWLVAIATQPKGPHLLMLLHAALQPCEESCWQEKWRRVKEPGGNLRNMPATFH